MEDFSHMLQYFLLLGVNFWAFCFHVLFSALHSRCVNAVCLVC